MKKLLAVFSFALVFNATASVEHVNDKYARPSEEEIFNNRACFEELQRQGCGDPIEEPEAYRSCIAKVHADLDDHCKKLTVELYGTRK